MRVESFVGGYIVFVGFGAIGYVANIIQMLSSVNTIDFEKTNELIFFIVQVLGVVFLPLGVILAFSKSGVTINEDQHSS